MSPVRTSPSPLPQDGSDDGSHAAHATTEKPKASMIPRWTRFLVGTAERALPAPHTKNTPLASVSTERAPLHVRPLGEVRARQLTASATVGLDLQTSNDEAPEASGAPGASSARSRLERSYFLSVTLRRRVALVAASSVIASSN